MPLSGSRDNLVGLSSSAGNSTIDIHVSVTINTNSPVSTLTNGGGLGTPATGGIHGHSNGGPHSLPLVTGNGGIFTPPGTLSDLKKQRSLIRTSSNPLTNGTLTNLIALPASTSSTTNYNNDSYSSSSPSSTFVPSLQTFKPTSNSIPSTISSSSTIIPDGQVPLSPALLLKQNNQKNTSSTIASFANCSQSSASSWHYYWNDWRNGFTYSQSQFDSSAFSSSTQAPTTTTTTTTTTSPSLHLKQPSLSSSSQHSNKSGGSSVFGGVPVLPTSATSPTLFPLGSYYFNSSVGGGGGGSTNSGVGNNNTSSNSASSIPYNCAAAPPLSSSSVCYQNNCNGTSCATTNTNNNPFSNNQHSCYLNNLTGGINDGMTKYHPPASPTMSLRRYVGDPAETVGDYGDGGKRCCVIV